jgi:hypothetical protein
MTHYDLKQNNPEETMTNNTSTRDHEKLPTKRYWISTYVLFFIATFLIYYLVGAYFHDDILLRDLFVDSFITHNIFYYLIVYRRRHQS